MLTVVDERGNLLGLVTLADLSKLRPGAMQGASNGTVRNYLSPHLVTATPEMDASRVGEMMRYKRMENIMVVEGKTLVGALSLDEAARAG